MTVLPIQTFALDATPPETHTTFGPYNRRVVETQDGIFATSTGLTIPPGQDVTLSATLFQFRLWRSTDGGVTFTNVYTGGSMQHAPPVVEADPNGTLYIVSCSLTAASWDNSDSTFYTFDRSNGFTAPIITRSVLLVSGSKYALALDWPRQCLHFTAWGKWYCKLNLDGTMIGSRVQVQLDGPHGATQYGQLALDEQGVLYLGSTTELVGSSTNYYDIHVLKSVDGGTTWQTLTGTPLTLPVLADDTGPLPAVILPDEYTADCWLASMLPKNGKLHLAYMAQSAPRRQHYIRYDLTTGQQEINLYPLWTADTLSTQAVDGFFSAHPDTERIYWVGQNPWNSTTTTLIAFYSDDDGTTWHDYGQSASLGGSSSNQIVFSPTGAALSSETGSLYALWTLNPNADPGRTVEFLRIDGTDTPLATAITRGLAGQDGIAPVRFRAYQVDRAGTVLADLSAAVLPGGQITLDNDRAVARDLSLTLDARALPASFLTAPATQFNIAVHYQSHIAGRWQDWPLGVFWLDRPWQVFTPAMRTWEAKGADFTNVLNLSTSSTTYVVPAGSAYLLQVATIIAGQNLVPDLGDDPVVPARLTPVDFTWPPNTPWLVIVNDLLAGINYYPLWADNSGLLTSRPRVDPAADTAAIHYDGNTEPIMIIPPFRQNLADISQGFNEFKVVIDDPLRAADYAQLTNTDPTSPVSTASLGYTRNVELRATSGAKCVYDTQTALQIADYELRQNATRAFPAELHTFPDPRRGNREVYTVSVTDQAGSIVSNQQYRVASWSLALTEGGEMHHILGAAQTLELTSL